MKKMKTILLALMMLALLGLTTGCGSVGNTFKSWFGITDDSDRDVGEIEDEPQILAMDAQERLDADDYSTAADLFRQLKDQYPYSKYALLAELKMGDALYLDGKYIEAQAAYEDFERLHPENDAVPYAIYQQGMTFYMRMQGIDRDQTPTIQTIQTLSRLVETFPDSKYAVMAKARISEAQNNLAGHEFYVGEFYYQRKDYQAALNRFYGLLEYYPDSGYHQRAMNYIAEYKTKLASGDIKEEGNLRDESLHSPFIATEMEDSRSTL